MSNRPYSFTFGIGLELACNDGGSCGVNVSPHKPQLQISSNPIPKIQKLLFDTIQRLPIIYEKSCHANY